MQPHADLLRDHHERAIRQAEAALRKTTDWNESVRWLYMIDQHEAALNTLDREQLAERKTA